MILVHDFLRNPMPPIDEHELYHTVLDELQTGVCALNPLGQIMLWNRGAEQLTGFKHYEVIGRRCEESVLPHCNQKGCATCGGDCPFTGTFRDGKPRSFPIQLAHKDGHLIQLLMHTVPIVDRHGVIVAVAQSFDQHRSAAESERAHRNLSSYGCLDDATGVPKSGYARLQLRESMAAFAEYRVPFAILLIQVTRLADFRASYGHPAGDAILRVIAQTIRNSLHSGDFLGRWTEGQFLVILPNCSSVGVEAAGDRLAKLVNCARLQWWGDQHSVTTVVGRALVQHGDTLEALLQRADPGLKPSTADQCRNAPGENPLGAAAASANG